MTRTLCAPCWEHGYCQSPDNCLEDQEKELPTPKQTKKKGGK